MARSIPIDSPRDTIVARATAAGRGAIAIVRLSGPAALQAASQIFSADTGSLAKADPGKLVLGRVHPAGEPGATLDQALAVQWRGPNSYTGEDVVEFHLHGSPAVVARLIEQALAAGARAARPGEFTQRAYINGRMDLAQAEAVHDLIAAQTGAAARAASAQLLGGLSRRIGELRAALIPVIAELEAWVDFPEEDLEIATRDRLGSRVREALSNVDALIDSGRRGRSLRDGVRVVLAGPPNAGKSSLFNRLVRRERAIVSPHPGTTRDTVEAEIDLQGVPLTLVDTAGLREAAEEIEGLGIDRTREEVRAAGLALFVFDAGAPPPADGSEYAAVRGTPHIVVANKGDLVGNAAELAGRFSDPARCGAVVTSSRDEESITALEAAILQAIGAGSLAGEGDVLVTNGRHLAELARAAESLATASEGIASALSPEFIAVDLVDAVARLDALTGRQGLDEDVLDQIFRQFCLGK